MDLCARRPLKFFAGALVWSLVLAAVHAAAVEWFVGRAEPTRGAFWIWAQGAAESAEPVAFWALRDFFVDDPQTLGEVELILAADESYVLWVNGRQLGAGSYRFRAPADRYRISESLQAGTNRILVELRSSRGAGGFVAHLRDGEGRVLLCSDDTWRVLRRAEPGVLSGLEPSEWQAPRIWRRHPTGRFRVAKSELRTPDEPESQLISQAPERLPILPTRLSHLSDLNKWLPMSSSGRRIPASLTRVDFGREVSGALELSFAEEGETGLIYFENPEGGDLSSMHPQDRRPNVAVAAFPGRNVWRDAKPRTFRYVALVGLPVLSGIRVLPTADNRPVDPDTGMDGVFGLPAAKEYWPMEELVWDRLREETGFGRDADDRRGSAGGPDADH